MRKICEHYNEFMLLHLDLPLTKNFIPYHLIEIVDAGIDLIVCVKWLKKKLLHTSINALKKGRCLKP